MREIKDIRQPIVQGLFYPDDPAELVLKIRDLLNKNPQVKRNSNTIIVPHGGWDYTGDYIAAGFNALPDVDYKRVIILSNVHREYSNTITIPESDYFLIGDRKIKVDLDAMKLIKSKGKKVVVSNIPHMEEHGIETVLPFVSQLYKEAKIVPILLGKTVVSLVRNLTNIIRDISTDDTLIIITSNFSDFSKREIALDLGEKSVELVENGKMSDLVELTRTNKLKTCGAGAISSLILLNNYNYIETLKQGLTKESPLSSGKATYYASIIFSNKE